MSQPPPLPPNGPPAPDLAADRRAYLGFAALVGVALILAAVVVASLISAVFSSAALSGPVIDLSDTLQRPFVARGLIWLAFGFALALMALAGGIFALPRRALLLHPWGLRLARGRFALHPDPATAIAYLMQLCPELNLRRVVLVQSAQAQSGMIGRTLVLNASDAARLHRQMSAEPAAGGLLAGAARAQEADALAALVRHEAHHCQTGDAWLAMPLAGAIYVLSVVAAFALLGAGTSVLSPFLTVLVLPFALPLSVFVGAWVFVAPMRQIEVWSELRADGYVAALTGKAPPPVDAPRDSMLRRSYPATHQRDAYLFGAHHGQTTTAYVAVSHVFLAVFLTVATGNLMGTAGILHPDMGAALVAGQVATVGLSWVLGQALVRDLAELRPKAQARVIWRLSWPVLVLCLLVPINASNLWLALAALLSFGGLFSPALRAGWHAGRQTKQAEPRPSLVQEFHAVGRFMGLGFGLLLTAMLLIPLIDPRDLSFGPIFTLVMVILALLSASTYLAPRSRAALLLEALPTLAGTVLMVSIIPVFAALAASPRCAASIEPMICVGDALMTNASPALHAARPLIWQNETALGAALLILAVFWALNGLILRKRWIYLTTTA